MAGISDAIELTKQIADLVKKGATLGLQERITELREAVIDAKDEIIDLRRENQALKERLSQQESWEARAAKFTHVVAPGGAHVYHSDGPPPHYICPRCYEQHHISILQDRRVASGTFDCPQCGRNFNVNPPASLDSGSISRRF